MAVWTASVVWGDADGPQTQHEAHKPSEGRSRARRRPIVPRQFVPVDQPRVGVVAQGSRPQRRDDGGTCGQRKQGTHPGLGRRVDAGERRDTGKETVVNHGFWEADRIERIHMIKRRHAGRGGRIQCQVPALGMADDGDGPGARPAA